MRSYFKQPEQKRSIPLPGPVNYKGRCLFVPARERMAQKGLFLPYTAMLQQAGTAPDLSAL